MLKVEIQELEEMVKTIGATGLTKHRYLKAFKEIHSRYDLISKIHSFHVENGTLLTLEAQRLLVHHRNVVTTCISLLDINNTIHHTPTWLSEWNSYRKDNSDKDFLEDMQIPKKPRAYQDLATIELIKLQNQSRAAFCKQRVQHQLLESHNEGWYVVFDTLTLADDKIERFYQDENAIANYCRRIGRMVARSEGSYDRSKSTTHCHKYFIAPEYGTKNGRLHFHVVHLFRTLPKGSIDPNMGRHTTRRNRRILESMSGLWPYGFTAPIAVRYSGDAFGRSGWLTPVEANGKIMELKPLAAVGHYVSKYVNKTVEQQQSKQLGGSNKWNNTLSTILKQLPSKLFRVRMSRGFGMRTPPMWRLSNKCLVELTRLHYTVSPISKVLSVNAKKEISLRLATLTIASSQTLMPNPMNLLEFFRASIQASETLNPQSFIDTLIPKLKQTGISNETMSYLQTFDLLRDPSQVQSEKRLGSK